MTLRLLEAKYVTDLGFLILNIGVHKGLQVNVTLIGRDGAELRIGRDRLEAFQARGGSVLLLLIGSEPGAFIEARVEAGAASTRRAIATEAFAVSDVEAAQRISAGEFGLGAIEGMVKSHKMRILALSVLGAVLGGREAPTDLAQLRYIGEALRKCAYGVAFAEVARAAIPQRRGSAADSLYGLCFDLLCDSLGYGDLATEICQGDRSLNGETFWYHVNLGHCLYHRGERAEADHHYSEAARLLSGLGIRNSHFNNSVFTWLDDEFCRAVAGPSDRPPSPARQTLDRTLAWSDLGDFSEAKAVHLVACDDGYFKLYGNLLITSSARHAGKHAVVHVHVCNPSEEAKKTLGLWARRPEITVRYSFHFEERTSKPLFTCLRFLVLQHVMRRYSLPVFITDIDLVVTRRWEETVELASSYGVGWFQGHTHIDISNPRLPGMRPWDVPAGAVYISNTDQGHAFARFVANYIAESLVPKPAERWYETWGVDQTALGQAIDYVVAPKGMRAANLKSIAFFRLPQMAAGGKAAFVAAEEACEPENFTLGPSVS